MSYTTIDNPGLFFNTVTYTGNGTTDHAITGVGFQPDWTWLKKRSNADDHILQDVVRTPTKYLLSNSTTAEATYAEGFKSFDSDGFTLGNANNTNQNTHTFVAWNWKAGGSSTTNPSGGTITTTASVNTTAGYSVFTYTGSGSAAHLAHGLGVAPTVVIIKGRSNSDHWFVKHPGIASNEYLYLNTTSAKASGVNAWSATNPDATKIYVGTDAGVNGSGVTYVCYAFAEKKGYSKFGSYTGGSDPFVYLGFKPAWVMFKNASATENWRIVDNKRDDDNPVVQHLYPNTNGAEGSGTSYSDFIDFLSNGFKIRSGSGEIDGSGNTIIYMAFAEAPFVTAGTKAAGTAR